MDGLARTADLLPPLCPVCFEQQVDAGRDLVLRLRKPLPGAFLGLGRITLTRGAIQALRRVRSVHEMDFLSRHAVSAAHPSRLTSAYRMADGRPLWVLT